MIVFETIGKRVQMVSDMDSNDVGSIWYCYMVIPAHLGLTAVLTGHEFEEYYFLELLVRELGVGPTRGLATHNMVSMHPKMTLALLDSD